LWAPHVIFSHVPTLVYSIVGRKGNGNTETVKKEMVKRETGKKRNGKMGNAKAEMGKSK
jgi:hypothetical protein